MADITSKMQGNVSDEGQVNWRGDQVSVVQGGQSIYETSSVKLADLGSRKVVGDRVFRYALSGDTIGAGLIASRPVSDAKHMKTTIATNAVTGLKALTIVLTTSAAANYFAEGYVHVQSGTAANQGYMYKIKSHGSIGDTSSGVFSLYDPIKMAIASNGDKVSVYPSGYSGVIRNTDQADPPVGIAPIAVVSGDYFWLQTWGPSPYVAGSAGVPTAGGAIVAGSVGMAETTVGATTVIIGHSIHQATSAEYGHAWLSIAP
jgi:hypothetical protein